MTERTAVATVVESLRAAGWNAGYVSDGGQTLKTPTLEAVLDVVFSVGVSHIHFRHLDGERSARAMVVLGNDPSGCEVFADWTTKHADFDDAMDIATQALEVLGS